MSQDMELAVSSVFKKDGKKYAFVSFTDGERSAEGKIPECEIVSNKGFSEEELAQLKEYMRKELPKLKKMAAGINVIKAMMKD